MASGTFRPITATALLALLPALASAQEPPPVRLDPELNFYGLPGLVDMPTAAMMPDGELAFSVSTFAGMTRGTLSFQVAPWLVGSFRYSGLRDWNADGFDTYYDRSFDLRLRLLAEGAWWPSIAVGVQDFIGTGLYSGEYVVADKSFADGRLSLTAGLGWGRLGSHNSFASTGSREALTAEKVGEGGKVNADTFFRGDVAAFAGLAYRPTDRLTLKAEYSSDAYDVEDTELGIFEIKSPFNFGVEYQVNPDMRIGAYALYGSQIGATLQFSFNPNRPLVPGQADPAPPPVLVRPDRATSPEFYRTDWVASEQVRSDVRDTLQAELFKVRLDMEALELTADRATLYLRNTDYQQTPQAIGRAVRLMSRTLPSSIETFEVVLTAQGMNLAAYRFARSDVERLAVAPDGAERILAAAEVDTAPDAPAPGSYPPGVYPRFTWDFGPYFRYSLFDPANPFRWEVGLTVGARWTPAPGVLIAGRVGKSIYSTLDSSNQESNSSLPRVRSDYVEYDKNGDPGIRNLYAAYYFQPAPEFYARTSVGYFERMHAGVSGEVLWAPHDTRYALGLELNYTRQRDFNGGLGFLDYEVATGHASLYWRFTDEYFGQVDAGRYLAGDYGATFALERVFESGWRVGAFATFTDVSAEEFGEGSFDKGITLTVPLNWFLNRSTRLQENFTIRPLQRDGGARLHVPGRLYPSVEYSRRNELEWQWGRFWR